MPPSLPPHHIPSVLRSHSRTVSDSLADQESSYLEWHQRLTAWIPDQEHTLAQWLELPAPLTATSSEDAQTSVVGQEKLRALMTALNGEAALITVQGSVVASNSGMRAKTLAMLTRQLDPADNGMLRSQVQALLRERCDTLLVFLPSAESTSVHSGCFFLSRTPLTDTALLWRALPDLNAPRVPNFLVQSFGLTHREQQVLEDLMSGHSAEDMAQASGRSIGTVRQQIKAVLGKLHVNSQVEAVTLVAQLRQEARQAPFATTPSQAHAFAQPQATLIGRHGQAIGYRQWGNPLGLPVLFIHGALFGIAERLEERQIASHLGLRVIAIERPGYGRSPLPASADPIEHTVQSTQDVLEHLQIRQCVVLAQDIGTVFAMHLAQRCPEQIRAVVCGPATPPMRDWAQTAHMPPGLRLHAWAAQRLPKLTNLLIDLGFRHVRQQGAHSLPQLVFKDSPFDFAVWNSAQNLPTTTGICGLIAAQRAEGFKQDMHLTNTDWSEVIPKITQPVLLLHGHHSQTVNAEAVAQLQASLPKGQIEWVDDAGHTLPLSHADLLWSRAQALAQVYQHDAEAEG